MKALFTMLSVAALVLSAPISAADLAIGDQAPDFSLKASDGKALREWLDKHGYDARPQLTDWVGPYVRKGWVITAFQIEKNFTKEEIFTFYGNQVYFGHGNYGVEATSRFLYSKSIKDLTLSELHLLADDPEGKAAALAELLDSERDGASVEVGDAVVRFLPDGPQGRPQLHAELLT